MSKFNNRQESSSSSHSQQDNYSNPYYTPPYYYEKKHDYNTSSSSSSSSSSRWWKVLGAVVAGGAAVYGTYFLWRRRREKKNRKRRKRRVAIEDRFDNAICLIFANQLDKATAQLEQIQKQTKKRGKFPNHDIQIQTTKILAKILLCKEQWKEATNQALLATRLDLNDAEAWCILGYSYMYDTKEEKYQINRYRSAAAAYRMARFIDPHARFKLYDILERRWYSTREAKYFHEELLRRMTVWS